VVRPKTRVVDEDVDPAVRRDGGVDRLPCTGDIRDIEAERSNEPAARRGPCDVRRIGVTDPGEDVGAAGRQRPREVAADPPTGPGDQRNLTGEIEIRALNGSFPPFRPAAWVAAARS
jgi:hypothetical protein